MPWNIPNLLTVSRLLLSFVFLFFGVRQSWGIAFWIFMIASLTDLIDGTVARLLKQWSEGGAVLDPLADKLLMFFGYLSLTLGGWLPVWLTVLVVGRDLMIGGGVLLLKLKRIVVEYRPTRLSKATTFCQMLAACLALIAAAYRTGDWAFGYDRMLAGALTLVTTVQYFGIGLRVLRGSHAKEA